MWLAYNTNGLAHHRLEEAFALLADLGYEGVALTPDVAHLDLATHGEREWEAARRALERHRLRCVVETGGRYLLDARRKHWPNLLTADDAAAARRLAWYRQALRLASALGARELSLWSGALAPEDGGAAAAWPRLIERLHRVLDDAALAGVTVCLEPEPGMLVDSLSAYRELRGRLARDELATTLDSGHLLVTEAGPAHAHVAEFAATLRNVQLDDARRGVHEHLPLGAGALQLEPFLRELQRIGYSGPLALELSRDSHRGADAAAEAIKTVRGALAAIR